MKELDDSIVNQQEAVDESYKRLQTKRKSEWGLDGHDIGIHELNMMIGGWVPTKVTTIAGRSGMGKTALTTQMFQAAGRVLNGRRAEILLFSWEMSPSYLVDRHICNRLGINSRLFSQGAKLLPESTMAEAKEAYKEARSLPVTYQTMSTNIGRVKTVTEKFVKQCREKEKVQGVAIQPVIAIDYIGMGQFDGGVRTYGIADFMNGCKYIANKTGASFCLFAQLGRQVDDKSYPTKADLSDSKSIEDASDNVVLIHRPENLGDERIYNPTTKEEESSRRKMLLRVAKGRDFGQGDMIINADVSKYRFWSIGEQFEYPYWEQYKDEAFWREYFKLNKIIADKNQLKIA